MNIILIDNHDSFTRNLYHLIDAEIEEHDVLKILNYETIPDYNFENVDVVIISPGPGHPSEYKLYHDLIDRYKATKKFLGVCLGFQILGLYFGAKAYQLPNIIHGRRGVLTEVTNHPLMQSINPQTQVGLYHSWALKFENNKVITVLAKDDLGINMIMVHDQYKIAGLQFHPESFLTNDGNIIIKNFLYW